MKHTKKAAKELSIKKWEFIVNKNGGNSLTYKQTRMLGINELLSHCGYCDKYIYSRTAVLLLCAKCPIRPKIKDWDDKEWNGCYQKIHPFNIWVHNQSIENAQAVLDLIKNS